MDTIESEIMILYQNFKNSKDCAKRLYDKIVILQNYEDNYNYKSILNSAYLKRKVSKVLFGIQSYETDFDKELNAFNNLNMTATAATAATAASVPTPKNNKSIRFNEQLQSSPMTPPNIEKSVEETPDINNILSLDEKELEKIKDMSIEAQQDYLVNKYLNDDDWDINAHINERRNKLSEPATPTSVNISQVLENQDTHLEKMKFIRNLQNAVLDDFEVDDNASTSTLSDNIE